eukprot:Opistho-2@89631
MLALIVSGLRSFVADRFGERARRVVDERALALADKLKDDPSSWGTCPDALSAAYVSVVADFANVQSGVQVLELLGQYWMDFVSRNGLGKLFQQLGGSIREALRHLSRLHDDLNHALADDRIHLPALYLIDTDGVNFELHAEFGAAGCAPILKGIVDGLARTYIKASNVDVKALPSAADHPLVAVVDVCIRPNDKRRGSLMPIPPGSLRICGDKVEEIFPFYLSVNYKLRISQMGAALQRILPDLMLGMNLFDAFELNSPRLAFSDYTALVDHGKCLFSVSRGGVELVGQMLHLPEDEVVAFLATPRLGSLRAAAAAQSSSSSPLSKCSAFSLMSLPIHSRLFESPFGDEDFSPLEETSAPESVPAGSAALASVVQMPDCELIWTLSQGLQKKKSKEDLLASMKKVTKFFGEAEPSIDHNVQLSQGQMDLTAPVEKMLLVLQRLKSSVDVDLASDIDFVIGELTSNYDVYVPNLEARLSMDSSMDSEFSDYLESFFPRQASLKFRQSSTLKRSSKSSLKSLLNIAESSETGSQEGALEEGGGGNISRQPSTRSNHSAAGVIAVPSVKAQDVSLPSSRSNSIVGVSAQVDREGYMTKRGGRGVMKNWRRRFFVLSGSLIYYYKNSRKDMKPLGVIDLQEFNTCRAVKRKDVICMEIAQAKIDTRAYYAHADTEIETREWIAVVSTRIAELKAEAGNSGSIESFAERRKRAFSESSNEKAPVSDDDDDDDDSEEGGKTPESVRKYRSSNLAAATANGVEPAPAQPPPTQPPTQPADSTTPVPTISTSDASVSVVVAAVPRPLAPSEFDSASLQLRTGAMEDLDFDVFLAHELTGGGSLRWVTREILGKFEVTSKLGLDTARLDRFLMSIERGYKAENPYHNAIHAADVTQTLYYFLSTLGLSQYLSDLDIFSAVIAATIHDYMHPGSNNAFQINTCSPEAMLYNDQSVLENMHLARAFEVISRDDCNIFSSLSAADARHARGVIIQMVLNTDMSLHFELLGKFKGALPSHELKPDETLPN